MNTMLLSILYAVAWMFPSMYVTAVTTTQNALYEQSEAKVIYETAQNEINHRVVSKYPNTSRVLGVAYVAGIQKRITTRQINLSNKLSIEAYTNYQSQPEYGIGLTWRMQ
jgi:hypothetical protein